MTHKDTDPREVARDYAWKWFEYHAGQRMTVFRFFLILAGALAGGCYASLQQGRYGLVSVLASLLIIFTFLFWRLDRRNRQLVKIGEQYMKHDEEQISNSINDNTIRLVTIADERNLPQRRSASSIMEEYFLSFRQIYEWIFLLIAFSGFLLLVYGIVLFSTGKSGPLIG